MLSTIKGFCDKNDVLNSYGFGVMKAFLLALSFLATPAFAEQMIPKRGSVCPNGTSYRSGGYCLYRESDGYYLPKQGSVCPGGTSSRSGGYCFKRY